MNYAVTANDPATRTALAVGDLADNCRSLDLFLRYETRYERQFHRALARLLDLKSRDPEPDSSAPNVESLQSRESDGSVPRVQENAQIATGSSEPVENATPSSQVSAVPLIRQAPAIAALSRFAPPELRLCLSASPPAQTAAAKMAA